jgi:hypothetical protein
MGSYKGNFGLKGNLGLAVAGRLSMTRSRDNYADKHRQKRAMASDASRVARR